MREVVRLDVRFGNGSRLTAVWPGPAEDDDGDDQEALPDPFFYVRAKTGLAVSAPAAVRSAIPEIGVIPILTPIDLHELERSRDTIVRNLSGRLASRHFRNQLWLLTTENSAEVEGETRFDDFLRFAEPWLMGTALDAPTLRSVPRGREIDVYFYENRRPRELAWAGDGFQVFLQLLYHCYRLRESATLVLDEPDVYLHPDLQRRLYQVVDSHAGQVIFASHSSELVAEAPPDAIVWVDRTRAKAVTAPAADTLEDLSVALGSGFNLRLAQVLRAKCVVFVEGDDMALLRVLAKQLGLLELVTGRHLATVGLGGAAGRARLESFGWVASELLKGSVTGFVLLDRDFRSKDIAVRVEKQMREYGLEPHVWKRKEIESYLLESPALARAMSAPVEWVDDVLDEESDRLRNTVHSNMTGAMFHDRLDKKVDVKTVTHRCAEELDAFWNDPMERRWRVPAKDLLSALNRAAQVAGYKATSAHGVARAIRPEEIAGEMRRVLDEINRAASS